MPVHQNQNSEDSRVSANEIPGILHVSTLGVSWRTRSLRGVVEAVLHECLRLSCATYYYYAAKKTKCCPNPSCVKRVSKSHDGGLLVGWNRKPNGSNDGAQGQDDKQYSSQEKAFVFFCTRVMSHTNAGQGREQQEHGRKSQESAYYHQGSSGLDVSRKG